MIAGGMGHALVFVFECMHELVVWLGVCGFVIMLDWWLGVSSMVML